MDIGIDLGTTFSVIAVNGRAELTAGYPAGIYLEECDVTIIPTPDGEETFPSVIMEDPDNVAEFLFGHAALQRAEDGFAPVMFSKRKIGTKEEILMQTRSVVAKDVAREFLRHLKRCAEQALGRPVRRAVVTHPAYFDRGAVEETRQAAIEAGFDMTLPEQMLMEPVAAALTYTRADKRDPLRILTYDLGGGTFDVTYLERRSGVIDMRAFDGDHLLGGYNFDRELAHWVRKRLEAQGRVIVLNEENPEDRSRLARLLRRAESVKIALAKADSGAKPVEFRGRGILADVNGKDVQIQERLTREQFVALIRPHLDRALECCRRALQKAGAGIDEVHEVLLVGGSTYGPWVAESLAVAFPSATPKLFHPDLCVGAGAAIHAHLALSPLITNTAYRLLFDTPETTVLEVITVAGQITDAEGEAAAAPLSVRLSLPTGDTIGPAPLTADGHFLFSDIELRDDQPNLFTLAVTDAAGVVVLEHEFQVAYTPAAKETSAVSTVLPKPLYIDTQDGLVPLAEEGARLPAKYVGAFERLNDNPNMSIALFQQRDEIGEVRVEGIPPEGGRGSFVDLQLEITEKNQIRGQAEVRTRQGKVVASAKVSVVFAVPEVPAAGELRAQFAALCEKWYLKQAGAGAETEAAGDELIQRIQRLLEQQPLERQEVHFALRQLDHLLQPPKDDLRPMLREFLELVENCREAIANLTVKAEQVTRQAKSAAQGPARGLDQTLFKNAQAGLHKAKRAQQALAAYERDGLEAHTRRDRKAWGAINSAVIDLIMQLRESPEAESWDTAGAKISLTLEILVTKSRLDDKENLLASQDKSRDWAPEISRIQRELQAALVEAQKVDDDLPPDQGLAQLRLIYARQLQPLKEAIDKLGIHIRTI